MRHDHVKTFVLFWSSAPFARATQQCRPLTVHLGSIVAVVIVVVVVVYLAVGFATGTVEAIEFTTVAAKYSPIVPDGADTALFLVAAVRETSTLFYLDCKYVTEGNL